MRKRWNSVLAIIIVFMFILSGCAQKDGTANSPTTRASVTSENTSTTDKGTVLLTSSKIAVDTEFTAKDLDIGYDESTANQINFNGTDITVKGKGATAADGVLTIKEEGTYVLSGTLNDGQVVISADEKAKIQLVLNGVTINSSSSAPIYIKSADKVFLTLGEGTQNTLTDGTNYVQTDDNTVDGVIFSKADMTINGNGTLNINANYKHGIVVKDKMVITGGVFNINSVKDAINGNDSVKIKAGTFNLSSKDGNGISCKNKEDETKGFVYVCGGEITVKNCVEGIEGTAIIVEGGTIDITSSNDGFNASNGIASASDNAQGGGGRGEMENDSNCYLSISGGTIHVNASGDGIDSNGAIYISGGTTYVCGPTENNNGGMDYNGTSVISGGTVIIAGSSGMAQGFSDSSTQYSIIDNLTSSVEGGTQITLKDSSGKEVASFTPAKTYQSVVISTPDLVKDGTYTLVTGDQSNEIKLSSISIAVGEQQGGPGGNGGFGGGGQFGPGDRDGGGGMNGQNGQDKPPMNDAQGTTN